MIKNFLLMQDCSGAEILVCTDEIIEITNGAPGHAKIWYNTKETNTVRGDVLSITQALRQQHTVHTYTPPVIETFEGNPPVIETFEGKIDQSVSAK